MGDQDVSIQKRAEMCAAQKNLDAPGTNSSNKFTVLSSIPPSSLLAIALGAKISLDSTSEEETRNIEIIKAKELAQAALYEAELRVKAKVAEEAAAAFAVVEQEARAEQMVYELVSENTLTGDDLDVPSLCRRLRSNTQKKKSGNQNSPALKKKGRANSKVP